MAQYDRGFGGKRQQHTNIKPPNEQINEILDDGIDGIGFAVFRKVGGRGGDNLR